MGVLIKMVGGIWRKLWESLRFPGVVDVPKRHWRVWLMEYCGKAIDLWSWVFPPWLACYFGENDWTEGMGHTSAQRRKV